MNLQIFEAFKVLLLYSLGLATYSNRALYHFRFSCVGTNANSSSYILLKVSFFVRFIQSFSVTVSLVLPGTSCQLSNRTWIDSMLVLIWPAIFSNKRRYHGCDIFRNDHTWTCFELTLCSVFVLCALCSYSFIWSIIRLPMPFSCCIF